MITWDCLSTVIRKQLCVYFDSASSGSVNSLVLVWQKNAMLASQFCLPGKLLLKHPSWSSVLVKELYAFPLAPVRNKIKNNFKLKITSENNSFTTISDEQSVRAKLKIC